MKHTRLACGVAMAALLAVTTACATNETATPASVETSTGLPMAAPETLGFSSEKLAALDAQYAQMVEDGKLAGIVWLASRHGKIATLNTHGVLNYETQAPIQADSIFRIASMTKPIAGVAMMQLWEDGKWKLDDPVSKYIPEFADLQVKTSDGGTEPMKTPMTMAQLMSHSAGFGVSAVYSDVNLGETDLQGMIDKLAALPLETQPGTAWDYGPVVNIQGYIVEKLSGQSLDDYMQENIFGPLGMDDTGFYVPAEKQSRVTRIYDYAEDGSLFMMDERLQNEPPQFLSGSGGLFSTPLDYWKFTQMLQKGGELNGNRIIKASTVEKMRENVLNEGVPVDLYGPDMPGIGFGMDFAVVMDEDIADGQQRTGSYYWGGFFGTSFWIDPVDDLVFIAFIQNNNGSNPYRGTPPIRTIATDALYEALEDRTK
ncbi:MAG: serine hydrolase [Ponticaulis sp.]|nr:serine hydrolase [Ponticaulis sp.]